MEEKGKKFDGEKVRVELIPFYPLIQIAKVMTFGAKKYGDNNWREGLKWSRVLGAILRHLFAWAMGEKFDPESGINHLAHAGCGVMFLLEFDKTHPELDDRPLGVTGWESEFTVNYKGDK